MKTIEQATPLLPLIIASNVVAEVSELVTRHVGNKAAENLAERAENHFQKTPTFRKKILGDSGREHLYAFMRHWLAGMLLAAGCPRNEIPTGWANGQPLPH